VWWSALRGRIDEPRFDAVLDHLEYQAGEAVVWRDSICNWFMRESGIADQQGRVGHYPDRAEAEGMQLNGYTPVEVTPSENASGGKAVVCTQGRPCSASYQWRGTAPSWHTIDVQYFDENTGLAGFEVFVNEQRLSAWVADRSFPSATPNGDTSVRKRLAPVLLRPGDVIRIVGTPEGGDQAALDFIAIN
jgi:alpha-glucuronidase